MLGTDVHKTSAQIGGNYVGTGQNGRQILLRGPSATTADIEAGLKMNTFLGHYDKARAHSAEQPRGQDKEGIAFRDFAYGKWMGKHQGLAAHPWYQPR